MVRRASSAPETTALGQELADALALGDVVFLRGDLGAGKTTLAQGIAGALGVQVDVQSPTFTIIAEYPILVSGEPGTLVHVDLYRLEGGVQLASIGIDDYLDSEESIVLIEWPERLVSEHCPPHWLVDIAFAGGDSRTVTIRPPDND